MAQRVKFHGKYKGVLVSRTDIRKLRKDLVEKRSDLINALVYKMRTIGEACIKIARELKPEDGSFQDVTGNLRSSIGYIVLYNGKVMQYGAPVQKSGSKGDGSAGVAAGNALLSKMKSEYPSGVVLVLCAGMKYAAFVENVRHKHVLIDAELEAERLLNEFM